MLGRASPRPSRAGRGVAPQEHTGLAHPAGPAARSSPLRVTGRGRGPGGRPLAPPGPESDAGSSLLTLHLCGRLPGPHRGSRSRERLSTDSPPLEAQGLRLLAAGWQSSEQSSEKPTAATAGGRAGRKPRRVFSFGDCVPSQTLRDPLQQAQSLESLQRRGVLAEKATKRLEWHLTCAAQKNSIYSARGGICSPWGSDKGPPPPQQARGGDQPAVGRPEEAALGPRHEPQPRGRGLTRDGHRRVNKNQEVFFPQKSFPSVTRQSCIARKTNVNSPSNL